MTANLQNDHPVTYEWARVYAWCTEHQQQLLPLLPQGQFSHPEFVRFEVKDGLDKQIIYGVLSQFSAMARDRMPFMTFAVSRGGPVAPGEFSFPPDCMVTSNTKQILLAFAIARTVVRDLILAEALRNRGLRINGKEHGAKTWINRMANLAAHDQRLSHRASWVLKNRPVTDFDTNQWTVSEVLAEVGAAHILGFTLNFDGYGLTPFEAPSQLREAMQAYLHAHYARDQK